MKNNWSPPTFSAKDVPPLSEEQVQFASGATPITLPVPLVPVILIVMT